MVRPSQQIAAIISGDIELTQASPAVQSWARFLAYREACRLMGLSAAGQKHEAMLMSEPWRDIVRAEFIRVREMRG